MLYFRDKENIIIIPELVDEVDIKWPIESGSLPELGQPETIRRNGETFHLPKIHVWNGSNVMVKTDFRNIVFYNKTDHKETKVYEAQENPNFIIYTLDIPLQNEDYQIHSPSGWIVDHKKKDEFKKEKIRSIRNIMLSKTDEFLLPDHPIDSETKERYMGFRQYLRNYTEKENWFSSEPLKFETWNGD
ncbi:phage tail assembly chaperone [Leptospira sp. 'Mane']|uniref:phage tail assembly chaperone n=1 Tax=Leptospira sp. 'Mane' TaxID=3387407 RepID=UPI00398ACE4E